MFGASRSGSLPHMHGVFACCASEGADHLSQVTFELEGRVRAGDSVVFRVRSVEILPVILAKPGVKPV